jgi:hypothetical protein
VRRTTLRFRILRDGTIDSISIVQSSSNRDRRPRPRGARGVPSVPPLPAEFPDSSLALRMRFENR